MNLAYMCQNTARKCAFFALSAAAAASMALGVLVASPAQAMADGGNLTYTKDGNTQTKHFSDPVELLNEAKASDSSVTISMTDDWFLKSTRIVIGKAREYTINMNGHMINREKAGSFGDLWYGEGDGEVISVGTKAKLTINGGSSSEAKTIEHKGTFTDTKGSGDNAKSYFWLYDGKGQNSIYGGLITGGASEIGGGICVGKKAKLNFNNVTVAGNLADKASVVGGNGRGGGIFLGDESSLDMDSSYIAYNHSEGGGGGIAMKDDGHIITMRGGSSISNNLSAKDGGAILFDSSVCSKIALDENSSIRDNYALGSGGAITTDWMGALWLGSNDGTGAIEGNYAAKNAGALLLYDADTCTMKNITFKGNAAGAHGGVAYVEDSETSNVFENVTMEGNSAAKDGGAIYAEDGCTITNSTLTGNTAGEDGGAVFVNNSDTIIDGCSIRGNACGASYEGGAVFVPYKRDLTITGLCVIKGNVRKGGTVDDVFLSSNVGNTSRAYIKGGVKVGSCIGVRTGITGDRRIGDNINNESKNCFFIDQNGYYVSYGDDHGGDMWQRHVSKQFLLQMNGQGSNHYGYGTSVLVNGASADADKAFWYWDAAKTTGLWPVSEYVNDDNLRNPLLSFTMPQWDVNLSAVYADRVKKGTLTVKAPVVGEDLPSTASFARADKGAGASSIVNDLPVAWQELKADGSKVLTAGVAKAGTSYIASVSIAQDTEKGLFFSQSIAASDVTLRTNGSDGMAAESASVDESTGTLTVQTAAFKTEGEASEQESFGTVTLSLENVGLMGSGASEISTASDSLAAMAADEDNASDPIDTVVITYDESSEYVTIVAPAREGYNFCNWEGVQEGWINDDVAGTVTIPVGELENVDSTLIAAYTPVVTEIDLDMAAPVAGKKLAGSVSSMKVTCSDGSEFDLLKEITGGESASVAWSPDATKAAGATRYTAVVDLTDGEGLVDVDKVLAQDAVVKTNGAGTHPVSGFAVQSGRLVFYATFAATKNVDAIAAKAVKGKTVTVKAGKKTGKTAKAKSVKIKAAKSVSGAKASFKLVSGSKLLKLNVKTGKVTLKKGAKKGRAYTAKVKVTYGYSSKKVKVTFKVK